MIYFVKHVFFYRIPTITLLATATEREFVKKKIKIWAKKKYFFFQKLFLDLRFDVAGQTVKSRRFKRILSKHDFWMSIRNDIAFRMVCYAYVRFACLIMCLKATECGKNRLNAFYTKVFTCERVILRGLFGHSRHLFWEINSAPRRTGTSNVLSLPAVILQIIITESMM